MRVISLCSSAHGVRMCGRHSSKAAEALRKGARFRPRVFSHANVIRASQKPADGTESLRATVKSAFIEAAALVLPTEMQIDVNVTECSNSKLGDYQCNSAMQMFAELKKQGDTKYSNPRSLADAIVEALPGKGNLFATTSVAGPGFINVTFTPSLLAQQVCDVVQNAVEGRAASPKLSAYASQRAIVDYSSPNIAKEMHVGHLRSTIIGETICRALESVGVEIIRLNHVGDWGTQFGMLLTHLHDMTASEYEIRNLQDFYKESKVRFDTEENFKLRSQAAVVQLQAGDEELIDKWKDICEISRREFEEIYDLLGIGILERGESFYNHMIPNVLEDLMKKGIAVESDGALCIFQDKDGPPLICRKSDGGFNYASTDLAAMRQRISEEGADWIIYVTDMGQSRHFEAVFDAALRAGWLNSDQEGSHVRLSHVGFGLVMGDDGKRFRTRSGDTVPLKSLLLEAQSRCLESLRDRDSGLSSDELEEAARIMGIGAVKYADLQNNRLTNYTFSYNRMLDLKGNTAVYLLYTHARISSILDRAGDKRYETFPADDLVLLDEKERLLALAILKFPDAIESTVQDLLPSRLCDYTYQLCVSFNEFYGTCKVVGTDQETSRLILCHATALCLRQSFHILGIEPLYRL